MFQEDPRKAGLEKYCDTLSQQIANAYAQLCMTTNQADKIPIQNQIDQYEHAYQSAQDKLRTFMSSAAELQQRHLKLHAHIHKIDFDEALALFRQTLDSFEHDCGAALFVIENSGRLCGDLCVSVFKHLLEEETRDFKPYSVDLSKAATPDEYGLFNRLGAFFELPAAAHNDLAQYAGALLKKLAGAVSNGSIVLFDLQQWDSLMLLQAQVLQRFLDLFWNPLLQSLPTLPCHAQRVKFVTLITADLSMAEPCHALCCGENIFQLQLRHWKFDEIQRWLRRFTDLNDQQIGYITDAIFKESYDGIPRLVYNTLKTKFS